MAQYAVIGLGRFGGATALELMKMKHAVLGIDIDIKTVNHFAEQLSRAVIADATDKEALAELDLTSYDGVLVAIGENVEACLVSVVHLKSLGVSNIWVKARSHAQHVILNKIGVSRIIHPEEEIGIRTAQFLSYPMISDYISLGSGDFIVEIIASARYDENSLGTVLDKYHQDIEVLLIKRKATVTLNPSADFTLRSGDVLVIFGHLRDLRNIAPRLR